MKRFLTILLLFIVPSLTLSCRDEEAFVELKGFKIQIETEEQNKEIVRRWINEVNKDNFEKLFDELWAKDCVQYMNSNSEPIESDQFKQMLVRFYSEFPGVTHEIHDIVAKRDKVMVRFSAQTKHDVESFGVPATGKYLEWKAISIFQISDGKIETRWEVADILSMYEQLGMRLQMKEAKK